MIVLNGKWKEEIIEAYKTAKESQTVSLEMDGGDFKAGK